LEDLDVDGIINIQIDVTEVGC